MFVDYHKEFESSTEIKNLRKSRTFLTKSRTDQDHEITTRRVQYLRTIEAEKLYYFALASDQSHPVIIVRSPSDGKEQKSFLGYERSGSKGDEGIKLLKDSDGHHITPLYDETDRANNEKINTLISANFDRKNIVIPEHLSTYVTQANLADMLDFSRVGCDKQISLTPKKTVMIASKWPLKSVEYFLKDVTGNTTKIQQNEIQEIGSIAVITQEQDRLIA